MVAIAEASNDAQIFPGLQISYRLKETKKELKEAAARVSSSKKVTKTDAQRRNRSKLSNKDLRGAILGGGDIAFALLFAGTIFTQNYLAGTHILKTSIVILGTTLGLALTLLLAKKDRFYPAMPAITAGALLGFGIALFF